MWSDEGWEWKEKEGVAEPVYWRNINWNGATQPAVGVSYWEAEAFGNWAGGRLPTEREWEAAARGTEGCAYPWGDNWENGICNSDEAGLQATSPVGIFPRSRSKAFELEDMAGNVWEWCADLFDRSDQHFPEARVLRGGSWLSGAGFCRAAIRNRYHPGDRSDLVGFRLVSRQNSA